MIKERLGRNLAYATILGIGSAAVLGGTVGCKDQLPETCLSPEVVSPVYAGDTTPGVTSDRTTWISGIEANTPSPPRHASYIGLIVGFKNPTGPNTLWNYSYPVRPADNQDKKISLLIGNGPVMFSTRYQATIDSPLCNETPGTRFTGMKPIDQIEGTKPSW